LVHEIGHRWIGEWTLLIDDGEPGAYFIKESLNEFMTMMFIRDRLGKKIYDSKMDRCRKLYQNVETTAADMPLIDMKYNNNNVIVYSKGPLVLDHIARMIGYSHLIAIIAQFYNQYKGKPNLHYEDFISVLSQKHPKAGNELNEMIKKRGL
jgi:aminopeptidase N